MTVLGGGCWRRFDRLGSNGRDAKEVRIGVTKKVDVIFGVVLRFLFSFLFSFFCFVDESALVFETGSACVNKESKEDDRKTATAAILGEPKTIMKRWLCCETSDYPVSGDLLRKKRLSTFHT